MALDFPSSPTNGQTFVSGNRTWTYNTTTSSWEASSVATSKTANYVYAAPNGSAGIPDFRALVAADLPNTAVTAGSYTYSSITVDAQGRITAASNGTAPVTSVTGTAPIVSSGGTTPAISISAATTSAAGSMSAADKTKLDGIAASANNYVLPKATASALGGVEVFDATVQTVAANAVTTTASRTYGVQLNAADQMVVNVPWTNSGGTVTSVGGTGTVSGLTLTGTVTASGNLTLGGTLSLTSANVTGGLGFSPSKRGSFPASPEGSVFSADIRNISNPTTGLGYAGGGRFRFSSLNDDSSTPYADVIDLSTYTDSSGGGFNSLYFGKNSQLIQHKYAVAGATTWTVKTLAYTDSNITGTAANITGVYGGTITSSQVTTALGFTPYNSTNPSGYITSSALSPYLLLSGGTLTGALVTASASGLGNGNPRSLITGYSGGNYGQIGYGISYTATSGVHNYAINDTVSLWEAFDGITVRAASGGTVGTAITWTTVLDARRSLTSMTFKGNPLLDSTNYTSYAMPSGSSATNSVDVRAPIFYDTNDTTYYVNPNSTSVMNAIQPWGEVGMRRGDSGTLLRSYNTSAGQATQFYVNHNLGEVEIGNARGIVYAGGTYWQIANSVRAPIMYDSNNTAYYIDPNAGSNVFGEFKVNQNGAAGIQLISTSGTQSLWIRTGYDNAPTPSVSATNVQFQSSGSSGGSFTFWSGNTLALTITGDYAQGGGSLRAPIFYDNNNTAYYVSPDTGSRLVNTLIGGNEALIYEGTTNVLNVRSGSSAAYKYFGFGTDGRFTASNGGITATSDARATIFYDVDNTAYYLNPNGDSFLVGTTVITRNANSNDVFGGLELRENNLQGAATGAASEAPGLNFHWSNRGAARIYMNGSGHFVFAGQTDITNNRRDIIFASGYAATRVDAPIFYDSNNTAFYFDGASTTNINTMSGSGKTMFETADGYLRINQSSSFANGIWTGSSNLLNSTGILGWGSNGGTTNSRVYINGGTYNGTNVIALDGSNGRITASDIRAPIFYDTDNTGFYVNPNGDTNLNRTFTYLGGKDTNGNWNTGFQNTPAAAYNFHGDISSGGPAGTWWFYESMRHSNGSNYWGTQIAWGWEDNANRLQQRNVSNGTFSGWVEYLNTSDRTYNGNLYMTGSIRSTSSDMRAPIFYDQDNTGYYVNPNGTSYINALNIGPTAAGSSYLNINGYNAYGGTGYHGFLTVSNTYGSATNPNQYWRINGAGGFEIVNSPYNAVLFTFTQGGDFTAAGNVTAYSDRKLKANFEPIENALSKVTQLNGVTFTRIDKEDTTTRYAGLIAQDVEAVLPEAVQINETISYGEVKSVDYNATIALLVEAIKEQQSHITKLEEKLNKLLGE